MMKKLSALFLAVLMVVALVPAVFASAEVDFSVPTDGKTAWEIASSYGKDLTNGTRATALKHGVDDCFDVYNGDTLVGTYKTLTEAWNAMNAGYTIKLKGNVYAPNSAANGRENGGNNGITAMGTALAKTTAGTYTIDGQGYILDIVVTNPTQYNWQYALRVESNNTNVVNFNFKNVAILSNVGVICFTNGGSSNAKKTVTFENAQLYGGNGYYKADPGYYGADFVYPTKLYAAGSANIPVDGYNQHAAMFINIARWKVEVTGADSVVYGRNSAIRGCNMYFTLTNGLVKTDDTMYGGTADANGYIAKPGGDSAAIFHTTYSNGNITINGGRVVNTMASKAASGIRNTRARTINVNGGEFYTTGSAIHVRDVENASLDVIVTINGGLFVGLEEVEGWANNEHNGMLVGNPNKVAGADAIFKINGGVFINQNNDRMCFGAATRTTSHAQVKFEFNGGTFLTKADSTFKMQQMAAQMNGTTVTKSLEGALTFDGNKTVMYQGEQYYVCEAPKATANELAPVMDAGAAMLLSDSTNGIRFTATVAKTAGATYGMLIAPTDYALKAIANNGALTKEALLAAATDTSKVVDIAATGAKLVDNGTSYTIVGDLTSSANDVRGISFTAVAYTVVGGETYYAAVDVTKNSRSISYIARMALGDLKAEADDDYANASIYNEAMGVNVFSRYTAAEQNIIKGSVSHVDEGAVKALIDIYFKQAAAE